MADQSPTDDLSEPGAPVAKDFRDPALIKLKRKPARVSVITSAGVVLLCAVFLVRLHGDRAFGGNDAPAPVTVNDIVAGKVDTESFITVPAEPMRAHSIRAAKSSTGVGYRVTPVRGASDRLWLILSGDGWDQANLSSYTGRLRKLDDLAFSDAVFEYAASHPRPLFATAAATRAGFGGGEVTAVSGDKIKLTANDRVALDVVDPNVALVVAAVNERFASVQAWTEALTAAGLSPGTALPEPADSPTGADGKPTQARYEIATPGAVAEVTKKLEAAGLWAARVEPITRHYETTWGKLVSSPPGTFDVGTAKILEGNVDLVGLYVAKAIPDDAYALIMGEKPQDYWFVLPITIALAALLLIFAWALVRAIKRDLMTPSPAPTSAA
ncbi:MAG: hypothetical protein JWP01_1539 [Myxococcales bacterium]|nr:hypothetical protein [Myxococcales bacterium]